MTIEFTIFTKFAIANCLFVLIGSAFFAVQKAFPQPLPGVDFIHYLKERFDYNPNFGRDPLKPSSSKLECAIEADPLAKRVLPEYGSMFAAADSIQLPPKCVFRDSGEVAVFQSRINSAQARVAGGSLELQPAALEAYQNIRFGAEVRGLKISLLDGPLASKRNYNDTVRIWNTRFVPALDYWVALGVIDFGESYAARNAPLVEQAKKVIEWESRGYKFGTRRSKSIFASTAPPGTSQHLSMIAVDIAEYSNVDVRLAMNVGGWYQTVIDDPPHFTFLGIVESDLPQRGLKQVVSGGFSYWVPNISPESSTAN